MEASGDSVKQAGRCLKVLVYVCQRHSLDTGHSPQFTTQKTSVHTPGLARPGLQAGQKRGKVNILTSDCPVQARGLLGLDSAVRKHF